MTAMFTQDDIDLSFGNRSAKSKNILEGLNPAQLEAVESMEGPLRIMAGAGTGKTTVIIRRIANIIRNSLAQPEQILAVTFTRKAAGEMRYRLGALLGDDIARRLNVGNFHAVSAEMLRRHSHLLGLPSKFTVLDDDGQRDVIANLAINLGYLGTKKDKIKIMRFQSQISSWKEDGHDSDFILGHKDLVSISPGANEDDPDFLISTARIFEAYQVEMEERRWCDFADLVLHMVRLFRKFPDVLAEESGRYRYIMVDEFQDTSPVQNEWVTLMAKEHHNICVVGDTDQSIYEWRNARPDIMLNFPDAWDNARTITIDTNYRSTQQILDIANKVVAPLREKDKLEKTLRGHKSGAHPKDFLRGYDSGFDEADEIADNIRYKIDQGETPSEIAILCRSGMIITGIERSLRDRGIRYIVAGAMKFTDREEVKDAIAWLTLAANPMDYIAFGRVASKPRRGLGPQKVGEIRRLMMENAWTVREAAGAIHKVAKKGSANARNFGTLCELLDGIETIIDGSDNVGAMLEDILDESGYMAWRSENDTDPQKDQRLENIEMIVDEARAYRSPLEFLEMISLQAGGDQGWGDDSIVISTVHASKGLEFNIVYCPAMEEGVFPNARSERTAFGADEERRLAHVAWTRARNELHISFAGYRMGGRGGGEPSRYLAEVGLMGPSPSAGPAPGQKRRIRRRAF